MHSKSTSWLDELECLIRDDHMLFTPFYRAWSKGTLEKHTLRKYAREYYRHVKAFPTYISSLHSRCEDPAIRRELLRNLIDEEADTPSHIDLWSSFALSLGVTRSDLHSRESSATTEALIDHFRTSCRTEPFTVGLTALYTYERQIPEICTTKIDGLRQYYGLTDPESYRYFSVHESVDVQHSADTRKMLAKLVRPAEEGAVLESARRTTSALNAFLGAFI
ncbi:MAG: CADD family putative folate metabolism protein [Simkaniaceae bacterium]|nr:CADD family putative folate metabolism protein [Simkaniaceae bacterium]